MASLSYILYMEGVANTFIICPEDYRGILGQIVGDDRVVGEEIFVVGWQYHLQSRLQNRKSSLRFGHHQVHSIEEYILQALCIAGIYTLILPIAVYLKRLFGI
nr:hypothetical protein Iba_chr13eCG8050 [Ipomoea batatas]